MTALDILRILELQSVGFREKLKKYEKEKNIKLPAVLCDFIDMTADKPLLKTADVWTGEPVFYSELIEKNEGEIPKNLEEYLLIGSDCGAGVALFGIKQGDLKQENPPVYLHLEGNETNDWECLFESVSDFLMTALCDVLSCVNYSTAKEELRKEGWSCQEFHDISKIQNFLEQYKINLDKAEKYKSIYGTKPQVSCFYDKDFNQLMVVKSDEGEMEMYVYSKLKLQRAKG